MKTHTPIIALVFSILIVSTGSVFAADKKQNKTYDLPEYQIEDLTMPTPVTIIQPRVQSRQIGQEAYMLFTIKANGHTKNVLQRGSAFNMNDLQVGLIQVIGGWKFEPARDQDGNPVEVKVGMRVKVVEKNRNNTAYAGIDFHKLEFIQKT